ncbi:hypothetical protein NPIL_293311 [Nephila pilipes]|uniref:Uncharacterized protein n=1 Tax=Nephila pilipes TaxID=299642 RepID=A0A8X6MS55_NEPPI|nr:hypothetical protein NPIL_293311 [Nephila pilipes]
MKTKSSKLASNWHCADAADIQWRPEILDEFLHANPCEWFLRLSIQTESEQWTETFEHGTPCSKVSVCKEQSSRLLLLSHIAYMFLFLHYVQWNGTLQN